MNDKFDELAKNMAQSVTRRGALKKFGLGLAGTVLASLGLASDAHAGPIRCLCKKPYYGCLRYRDRFNECLSYCGGGACVP